MTLSKTKSETNYMRVAGLIREDILSGRLPPGASLRLTALASAHGVSVQPVREALQQLEGEGLVEIVPNAGARVRGLDRQRVIHNHEIGAALESFAARRFSQEASHTQLLQLEQLQKAHDAALDSQDMDQIERANFAFHRHINSLGGNDELVMLVSRYYSFTRSLLQMRGRPEAYLDRVRREHHALLDAFRRHDEDAAARLGGAHVHNGLLELLQIMEVAKTPAG